MRLPVYLTKRQNTVDKSTSYNVLIIGSNEDFQRSFPRTVNCLPLYLFSLEVRLVKSV